MQNEDNSFHKEISWDYASLDSIGKRLHGYTVSDDCNALHFLPFSFNFEARAFFVCISQKQPSLEIVTGSGYFVTLAVQRPLRRTKHLPQTSQWYIHYTAKHSYHNNLRNFSQTLTSSEWMTVYWKNGLLSNYL